MPARTGHQLFLLLILALVALVGSRLRWSANPGFLHQESYGLAYTPHPPLGALCDPSPLAGLEGPNANVTDQRSLSLIYVTVNKVLGPGLHLYTAHRIISVILYAIILVLLLVLARLFELHWSLALLLIVHYGFSAQLLSYIFQEKLTLSSVAWCTAAIALFVAIAKSAGRSEDPQSAELQLGTEAGAVPDVWATVKSGDPKSHKYTAVGVFLLPLLVLVSYETYCVARPLAVGYVLVTSLWLLTRKAHRTLLLSVSALGYALAYSLFRVLHPAARLDHTLFEGRTESIVQSDGQLMNNIMSVVIDRILELGYLFHWPTPLFSSEFPTETGWLDVLIALALGAVLLIALRRRVRPLLRSAPHLRWAGFLLTVLAVIAAAVPLFSTTALRGHRFFGFYLATTLLLALMLELVRRAAPRWLAFLIITLSCAASAATLAVRAPLVFAYRTEPHFTPEQAWTLLEQLRDFDAGSAAAPNSRTIYVCDRKQPVDWVHWWNAALYVSGLGCRLGGSLVLEGCPCPLPDRPDLQRPSACLERRFVDGRHELQLHVTP